MFGDKDEAENQLLKDSRDEAKLEQSRTRRQVPQCCKMGA